jgi:hypothetical protein
MMDLWMYYETDGDSGYYNIKLFKSKKIAEDYKRSKNDAYGQLDTIGVNDNEPESPIQEWKCPECMGPMAARANRQTGQKFWGCKKYPECKGTRDSEGLSRDEREALKNKDKEPVEQDPMFRFERRR